MVTFSAINNFGTYSCTVTNSAGEMGTGNVTIMQGSKFTTSNLIQHVIDTIHIIWLVRGDTVIFVESLKKALRINFHGLNFMTVQGHGMALHA